MDRIRIMASASRIEAMPRVILDSTLTQARSVTPVLDLSCAIQDLS
jgi:hypothetical protein